MAILDTRFNTHWLSSALLGTRLLKTALTRWLRLGAVCSLCLSLIITPQMVLAANVLLYSNLSTFDMDLGNATLHIAQIDSNVRLSLTAGGALEVSHFRAKHATLRFKPQVDTPAKSKPSALPAKIDIPLPIQLQQGLIDELVIEQANSRQVLKQMRFHLQADQQSLQLALKVAESPWGTLETAAKLDNKKPFALNGWLTAQHTQASTPYQLKATLGGDLAQVNLNAQHIYRPQALPFAIIPTATANTDGTASIYDTASNSDTLITVAAQIGLQDQMPSRLNVAVQKLNAGYIHPQLQGMLNLSLLAEGPLSGAQPMQVDVTAHDSQLQQRPLTLTAHATLLDLRLASLNLHAQVANNQLAINGGLNALDATQNTLRWRANLPDLSQLLLGFAGQVNASGDIIQQPDHQQYHYQLAAQALTLPGATNIDSMRAKGEFSSADNGLLDNQVSIKGLRAAESDDYADSNAISANLALTGSVQQHTLTLAIEHTDDSLSDQKPANNGQVNTSQTNNNQINVSQAKDNASDAAAHTFGLSGTLTGGVHAGQWAGQLTSLQSRDLSTLKLLQPAPMSYSPQAGFKLENVRLQLQQNQAQQNQAPAGLLAVDTLSYVPAATASAKPVLTSNGRLQSLPLQVLQVLQDYFALGNSQVNNPQLNNTLALDGEWRINIAEHMNADIQLRRASGDLAVMPAGATSATPLGLTQTDLSLKVVNNQIQASTNLVSTYAGSAQASVASSLTSTHTGFSLNRQTPFSLTADAHLQHLNWLSLNNARNAMALDGQLDLALKGDGLLDAPQLRGTLTGKQLQIEIPSEGVALKNGVLDATFAGKTLQVTQLDFAGKTGTLNTTGEATILTSPPHLKLNMTANRFTALSRTDRLIVLSGQGDIHMDDQHVLIGGNFKILNGLFELPKAGKPTLDDDVVIVGYTAPQASPALPIILGGLNVDFGKKETPPFKEDRQFLVRGMGVNGALSGQIKLSGNVQQLNAFGMLEVNGTYYSYGQLLNIETGQVNFSGPMSNAGLNIVAMRDLEPTKVGIKLTGELKAPRVSLVSEPESNDNDKLSMLVLGRPMSEAANSELALLSVAAGALLSQGDSVPLQARIAGIVGLDNIDVKGTSATDYSVTVGKRINRRLVIGYEKSLFGLLNVAKLTYQLTRRIAIETKAGSDNSLDVIYSLDFD